MRLNYAIMLAVLIMISACTNSQPENKMPDINEKAEPTTQEGNEESGREIEEVENDLEDSDETVENLGEVLEDTVSDDTMFCEPGGKYKYSSADGDVESIIIGLEAYKGKEFCKAESKTTIPSQMGSIDTDTTYYFNKDASEMWIITVTSSKFMPQPQTNEIHIVDGEAVN